MQDKNRSQEDELGQEIEVSEDTQRTGIASRVEAGRGQGKAGQVEAVAMKP